MQVCRSCQSRKRSEKQHRAHKRKRILTSVSLFSLSSTAHQPLTDRSLRPFVSLPTPTPESAFHESDEDAGRAGAKAGSERRLPEGRIGWPGRRGQDTGGAGAGVYGKERWAEYSIF